MHIPALQPDKEGARKSSGPVLLMSNCRYLSHFRSIHRGAYFAQMRTTAVRKLLPESWGFLCPVHTPDGSPCGLLNHFAAACRVVTEQPAFPEDVQHAITQARHS